MFLVLLHEYLGVRVLSCQEIEFYRNSQKFFPKWLHRERVRLVVERHPKDTHYFCLPNFSPSGGYVVLFSMSLILVSPGIDEHHAKQAYIWSWRDVSVVKHTSCSSRGVQFRGSSQVSGTPVARN